MSEVLDQRAELLKLARLLGSDEDALASIAELPSAELRQLRDQITERLFNVGMLSRVGAAAKMLPSNLAATIAERAFGPLLCARAAGSADPAKAIDIARRLPPAFLADTTVELDPRRVAPIIAGVPSDLVVGVARIMGERQEYVTMGRFLAFVPDSAIATAMGVLSDEAMLRTAFVLEHKDRLDHAVGLLPPERLPGIIACAAENDLWPEALDLVDQLSDARKAPIADIFANQSPEVIAGLVAAVSEAGIWESLLPIVRLMSREGLVRLTTVTAFHDRRILAEIIDAASTPGAGLWRDLAPLVAELTPEVRATAADIAVALPVERIASLVVDAAEYPEALPPLALLLDDLDGVSRDHVALAARKAAEGAPDAIATIVIAALRDGFWREGLPLLELLPVTELMREFGSQHAGLIQDAIAALPDPVPPELAPILDQLRQEGLIA